jgi:hypothetical protein
VNGAVAGDAAWQNLAALRNVILQEPGILEINYVDFLNAKTANAAAPHTTSTAALRATSIEIFVSVEPATAFAIFIVCCHSFLVNRKS